MKTLTTLLLLVLLGCSKPSYMELSSTNRDICEETAWRERFTCRVIVYSLLEDSVITGIQLKKSWDLCDRIYWKAEQYCLLNIEKGVLWPLS